MEKLLPYKQMIAGSVPALSTMFLLLIWWFAVISPSDPQPLYLYYVKYSSCKIFERQYSTIPNLKVTTCQWEGKS